MIAGGTGDVGVWMAPAIAAVAALYGSVGHGGASGYLALMAMVSIAPSEMKASALSLNLLVAGIGAINYVRAGHFRFHLLWPFLLMSAPMSYVGAQMKISSHDYGLLLAVTLIWAGARLAMAPPVVEPADAARPLPALGVTLLIGASIGWVSGVVGVGGGIFLSPVFLLMRWANPRETGAVSAVFIWVNSALGMAGHVQSGGALPADLWLWTVAAGVGGFAGSYFGARKFSIPALRRILAAVLLVAAVKSAMMALK